MNLSVDFVLASRSPRRRRLLEMIGMNFHVQASDAEEHIPDDADPAAIVGELALTKAAAVAPSFPAALTLGADTIVVLDGDILGKPADADEACAMLGRLQNRTHTVYTGIALIHPGSGRRETAVEQTQVTFAPLSADEIDAYVGTGSPMDKAGAYGIQDDRGALFVRRIDGDYYNVVGLPLHRLYTLLRTAFADLLHTPPTHA